MSDKNSYYIINTNDKLCVDLFVISILQIIWNIITTFVQVFVNALTLIDYRLQSWFIREMWQEL